MVVAKNMWRDLDGSDVQNNSKVMYHTDTGKCGEITVIFLMRKSFLKILAKFVVLMRNSSRNYRFPWEVK